MSATYIEYNFKVTPAQPASEILIAELGYAGFESFVEQEEGVLAYIQKEEWNTEILNDIQVLKNSDFNINYTFKEIEQVNWNEAWEKNFQPIEVDGTCVVRAPFHNPFNVNYEIIIEPKMSFGTGHHETTFMMLQFILENNFEGKSVLDMGCGTAVLAILASLRGAQTIEAIDIDDWCVENSIENVNRNNCNHISVKLGDASVLPQIPKFNTIIANINRNILIEDMPNYVSCLKKCGELYLSGFYVEDLPIIEKSCNNLGLTFVESKEKNNWVAAKFVF